MISAYIQLHCAVPWNTTNTQIEIRCSYSDFSSIHIFQTNMNSQSFLASHHGIMRSNIDILLREIGG